MTQISLVLPFALPPPELATDLVRALKAPALASLITRTASHQSIPFDGHIRALPHELWLARALGLGAGGHPAFAAAAMRGFGLAPAEGNWFIVNPAHIEIARSHLLMTDTRTLHLADEHARALFDAAKPYFDEAGKPLLYGDAHTWFMRADGWADLETSTPDAAVGLNLTDWLPRGAHAIEYRKLQNEVQMLWYEHPANSAREQRGLAPINSFWPWAGAQGQLAPPSAPILATLDAPAWLAAFAKHAARDAAIALSALIGGDGRDTLLVCGSVTQAGIAGDWSAWLMQMQQLDETLFAPLLSAVTGGRLAQLKLVLSRRDAHAEFTTTKLAQHKFWRRPTLDRLLP